MAGTKTCTRAVQKKKKKSGFNRIFCLFIRLVLDRKDAECIHFYASIPVGAKQVSGVFRADVDCVLSLRVSWEKNGVHLPATGGVEQKRGGQLDKIGSEVFFF